MKNALMRSEAGVDKRCSWVNVNDPLLLEYHDREWGVPVHSDPKHFEVLVLSGAQAGLNWSLVLKKREGYRRAFDRFNPERVARYSEKHTRSLLADPQIIRNRLKIEAAVRNARAFLKIQESKDLKQRGFSFVGPTVAYAYMQAAGLVNDHLASCFRYRELRSETATTSE